MTLAGIAVRDDLILELRGVVLREVEWRRREGL
jgi:hypothetical protein